MPARAQRRRPRSTAMLKRASDRARMASSAEGRLRGAKRPGEETSAAGMASLRAVVWIVTLAGVEPVSSSVSVDGDTTHSAAGGAPEHPSVTVLSKPPAGSSVRVKVADSPAAISAAPREAETESPGPFPTAKPMELQAGARP